MSYLSNVRGSILVDPPASPLAITAFASGECGARLSLAGDQILGMGEDSNAQYIQEIVEAIVERLPDRQFSGSLEVYGEEPTDISRIVVRGGRVVREEAEIVWPGEA